MTYLRPVPAAAAVQSCFGCASGLWCPQPAPLSSPSQVSTDSFASSRMLLRFMARLTRRFISKAKEKNLRRLISANGIIAAAFNCILFPLELSFATPGSLCLNTAAAAAANSFGWWHAFFWADLNLWVDLFRRHIFPTAREEGAQEGQHVVYRHRLFIRPRVCYTLRLARARLGRVLLARPPRASRPRAPALQAPARVHQLLLPRIGHAPRSRTGGATLFIRRVPPPLVRVPQTLAWRTRRSPTSSTF